MKKRIWFLTLPVLLLISVFWVRHNTWKRIDNEFRLMMVQQAKDGSKPGIMISCSTSAYSSVLGIQTPAQLEKILADVHLQPASKGTPDLSGIMLTFEDYSSNSRDAVSFSIDLDGERNWIATVDTSGDSALQKWNDFQLTPESVRVLKKRAVTLYGKKIEDFKKRASTP